MGGGLVLLKFFLPIWVGEVVPSWKGGGGGGLSLNVV